ncbi:MAG TPA: AsmA family protein, partial [Afifellaceae bacterium]|nr:AsmA family protein [Afifellaceae bacterium]
MAGAGRRRALNRLYIAIGLLIIFVLSTALVAPYLIDWTSYRETFEREAGAYLGKPVKVAGKANVRLLPTPTLNFTDVRVGDADRPDLTIENIKAELELPALLKGDLRVIQMRVDRPTLRLDLAILAQPEGELAGEGDDGLDPDTVSLDSMEINSGQVLLFDSRTGQQWTAMNVNAQVEARSLTGPGKIEGGLLLNGDAISFRASAGRMASTGVVPLKMTLYSARLPFVTRLSGKLLTRSEDGLVYEGGFTTSELADLHDEEVEEAGNSAASGEAEFGGGEDLRAVVSAVGEFRLSSDRLNLPEVQINYGLGDRPLQLAGDAEMRLGASPYFNVNLEARQIDIDRALGGGPNDPVAISKAFKVFVENLKTLPLAPIDGELHLDAKGVVVGGSVIQAVGADLSPLANGWQVDVLSALLPGQTRIDVSGTLNVSGEPGFKGTGKLESNRPAAFASWWRGEAGSVSLIDRFSIQAALDLSENRQAASELVAGIDDGTVRGSINMRHFQQSGSQVFVDVALVADSLDLEKAQALSDLFVADAISGGQVDRMVVDLEAGRLFAGGVNAENVELRGTLEPAGFDLKALSVENLAGARISASGRIDDPMGRPGGRVNVDIAAEDLSGTARFLKGLFPENAAIMRFGDIATSLSPAEAQLLLSARKEDNGLALDLTGSFGGTRVNLEMNGRSGAGGIAGFIDPATLEGQVDGLIVAEQSADLLRQAGFDILPLDDSGPARIALKVAGKAGSALSLSTDGTLAGIGFRFNGKGRVADGKLAMKGDFSSQSDS